MTFYIIYGSEKIIFPKIIFFRSTRTLLLSFIYFFNWYTILRCQNAVNSTIMLLHFFRRLFMKVSFTNSMGSINISINIPSTCFFNHTHNIFKNILASFFLLTSKTSTVLFELFQVVLSLQIHLLQWCICCWSIYFLEFSLSFIYLFLLWLLPWSFQ